MSNHPVKPPSRWIKPALVAVAGAYVTTRYLNTSSTNLFVGGAITGYAVAKCANYDKPGMNAVIAGSAASFGTNIALGLGLPADNTLAIIAMSLALPFWL